MRRCCERLAGKPCEGEAVLQAMDDQGRTYSYCKGHRRQCEVMDDLGTYGPRYSRLASLADAADGQAMFGGA